jgi:hypothetical protein
MADGFGKIDFKLACRFGELTANEMRVLVYLYACRNEETRQCNPSRKTICADTGLDKGNLSKAISGLEEKEWVLENLDGNFDLFSADQIPEKVVSSTTKVVSSTTQKVVKVTTEVVEVTTKSCRTNNPHIKELNRERTEKEQRNVLSEKSDQPAKRKESDLSPEQKQAFNAGMDFLKNQIGKFPDHAAQGKALKWMIQSGANIEQIKSGLRRQVVEYEGTKYRVSYLTLQKDIFRWLKDGNGIILMNGAVKNGNSNQNGNGNSGNHTGANNAHLKPRRIAG